YGRQAELEVLARWLVAERCRLIALVGMGGIGKTTLAVHLAEALAEQFDVLIWRSLVNAPPFEDLLRDWLQALTPGRPVDLPMSLDARLQLLLDQLRQRRCLLILDNLETLLQEELPPGATSAFLPGYAEYGQLLMHVLAAHADEVAAVAFSPDGET